jgi:cytochrome c oxidase cbb3-type subunit II
MSAGKSFWEMDELRIVTGAMVILSGATALLVVMPYMLLKKVAPPAALKPYSSEQLAGRQSYIANGCVYCHSQQPRDIRQAPDATRGWGRASVAGDYAYDTPHLLGTMRTGPDLLNIGARQPSKDWQLGHLYQPRAYTPGSIMPPYPFLFEVRDGAANAGETVVNLPPSFARPGQVVVAKPEALALVAYLLSLNRTYPALAPLPAPAASAPAAAKDKP